MDVTTIVGIVAGMALIIISIMDGGEISGFLDPASAMIVLGGTISAVIASYPLNLLKGIPKHMGKLISNKAYNVPQVIEQLVEFAQLARKNGLLALEEQANALTDPFFKQGIMYVVDAMEADKVRELLENDLAFTDKRHDEEIGIYEKAAGYAPAFGMIGTLVGLINMLASMDLSGGASSSLGASMSVALVTTLYGSTLSNLFFAPIAKKLRIRNEEELLYKMVIIEGVIGIQAGENPKTLKERLVSQLRQKDRAKLLDAEGGGDSGGGKKKKSKK